MVGVLGFSWASLSEAFVVLCLPVYVLHTDEKFSAVALFGFWVFGVWHWVLFGLLRFSVPHVSHKMNHWDKLYGTCFEYLERSAVQETWGTKLLQGRLIGHCTSSDSLQMLILLTKNALYGSPNSQ